MGNVELDELETGVSDSTIVLRKGIVVGGSILSDMNRLYVICSGRLCDCRLNH